MKVFILFSHESYFDPQVKDVFATEADAEACRAELAKIEAAKEAAHVPDMHGTAYSSTDFYVEEHEVKASGASPASDVSTSNDKP
jgi:hypothetical protein